MVWRSFIAAGLLLGHATTTTYAQPDATGADCGCLWQGSFSEVAATTDLVVLGEVQRIKGNAVDLKPQRVLHGEFWLDSMRVWMRTRNCRRREAFPEGSRWIMALANREMPRTASTSTPTRATDDL